MNLKGSKTEKNLKDAFAGESQANRRYLYFAAKADVEGYNDVSAVFRSTAEGETGHAHGHLEYLEAVGDPATGLPIGDTKLNLKAAIAGETHEYTDMYPGMAKAARDEGFDEIADWFETLAKAERSHANRFQKALDTLWQVSAARPTVGRALPGADAVRRHAARATHERAADHRRPRRQSRGADAPSARLAATRRSTTRPRSTRSSSASSTSATAAAAASASAIRSRRCSTLIDASPTRRARRRRRRRSTGRSWTTVTCATCAT